VRGRHAAPGDSHVVNTSWAMLSILAAGAHIAPVATDFAAAESGAVIGARRLHDGSLKALHRASTFLLGIQNANGDWPQQHISGVFNQNCMITYANYRNIFPIWALGLYRRCVLLGEPNAT
jgi:cycloartenol synthase